MTIPSTPSTRAVGRDTNRQILRLVNRTILSKSSAFVGSRRFGDHLRSRLVDVEGDVADSRGIYEPELPPELIDVSNLSVPWSHLAVAIHNEDVTYRTFEKRTGEDFYLILDLSRSMRYPLRRLYADEGLGDLGLSGCLRGKPSLLKWVAATALRAASAVGFTIRIVTLGADGVREGARQRPDPRLSSSVMDLIDRRFEEVTAHPRIEGDGLYHDASRLLARRPGVFLFCGDWLDAVWAWDDHRAREEWRITLELFRQWGRTRPLIVARVNDFAEVAPPPPTTSGRVLAGPMWGDCRHRRVEDLASEMGLEDEDERIGDALHRLRAQHDWSARLEPTLRRCCRGYLALNNRTPPDYRSWGRAFRRAWDHLLRS
jgi:hypothetical protein